MMIIGHLKFLFSCFSLFSMSCLFPFPLNLFVYWDLSGPMNPGMTLSPAHQIQISSSPNQIMYQAQGSCYSPGPHRSPIGMVSPFTMHPRTPEVWNGPIGPTSNSFPYNPARGGLLPSPGFGPRGSPHFNTGQGRGHWVSHSPTPGSGRGGSPSPGSGRGGSCWYGSSRSPGLGQSSGRGRGSRARLLGPEQFYNESMLEDPWKFLKPVVWRSVSVYVNSLNTPNSSKSWITKSLSTKNPKVSEPSNKSSSQPSLAEYLAASFNEAVNNAPGIWRFLGVPLEHYATLVTFSVGFLTGKRSRKAKRCLVDLWTSEGTPKNFLYLFEEVWRNC